ncbi:outer membrane beta-barrel family protein [Myroides ceti]|uniref:Outer membrane beta-barrel family protein n=1 Tax=Paenimyroides ceti TaxID=395087 RepID=A0ABT8CVM6_9FLAO|nr:outer membrane beta-barrel family protein [Paenimyroides ceti]MDN3707723.1 outer membrane beta-barrel family protein [Paenimyroides ceti]MDN3709893.1 outer membrane beta-barrel family protein [Paenimyroides ceti]
MKIFRILPILSMLFITTLGFSQQAAEIYVKGTVVEAKTNQPLEYASITLVSTTNPSYVTGDMTDASGQFNIPILPDTYEIKIEFLGYQTLTISNKEITSSMSLGMIKVESDSEVLEGLVIETKRADVEFKLDKKVYNVSNDNINKGGTASDVLDNIPSVAVDADGNVSLRGNESVRVLIDGKPSGMASNIADALKMLSSESIEQVEIITNPSARYEAEGGAGIINIILKKGSNQGVNGSVTANVSNPFGYSVGANINYKEEKFNLFANLGYRNDFTKGNSLNETEYIDQNTGLSKSFVNEYSKRERKRKGYNANFGFEYYLTDKLTWNNNFTWRRSDGDNPNDVNYDYYDAGRNLLYSNRRYTAEDDFKENVDYSTDFTYKFNDKGHQLFVSGTVSKNFDREDSDISTSNAGTVLTSDLTNSRENELRNILRLDYVLPIGEGQFEAGYLGNFNELNTKYNVTTLENGEYIENEQFKNNLEYLEKVNALYAQYGNKYKKFSYMVGLRWEASEIDVNQLVTNDYNKKKYNNFFPSAFLNYELTDSSTASISYSKRVRRPRGWSLNPISNYSSSINFYRGNPDLDPSFTDAFDLGFMKRWYKLTLNTSVYYNRTTDATQFIRIVDGVNEEGIPITISSPINLNTEYRYGLEFNVNYNPFKWWRLNGNINLFQEQTRGDYTYTDTEGNSITQNFDNDTFTWSSRVASTVNLPGGIDWQTTFMYRGPRNTAQGKILGEPNLNLAFSKDIWKDKATIALNVQDVFNSRKMRSEIYLDTANSYSERQWRERTINLSFTYRFNQKKAEKPGRNGNEENGGEEYM